MNVLGFFLLDDTQVAQIQLLSPIVPPRSSSERLRKQSGPNDPA